MNPIQMVDPAGEYRALKAEIDAAVGRVFASGRFVLGPEGEALEREIAHFVGADHAVGVQLRHRRAAPAARRGRHRAGRRGGDSGIHLLRHRRSGVLYRRDAGVRRRRRGHVQPRSCVADEEASRRKPRRSSRCTFSANAPTLDEIARICREKKLVLVEDCAQCIGADYDGKRAGSWGDFGGFSFYPTKNLGAAGDAGLMTAKSEEHAKTLRMLRHHGSRQTYLHERVGWNSRLDELQAAVLRVKLRHLERFNEARRAVARRYREKLAGAKVILPAEHGRGTHVYHQFTIRSERRDAIREALAKEGIASSVFYPDAAAPAAGVRKHCRRGLASGRRRRSRRPCCRCRSIRCSTKRRSTASRPACAGRREACVHQDAGRGQRFCRAGLHAASRSRSNPAQLKRIADRHLGVGCDQILVVERPRDAGGGLPLPHLQRRRRRGRAVRQRRALLRQVRARARPHRRSARSASRRSAA